MTVLTRWDPFREFSTLQDRMNRLFQQSYGDREEALTTSTFAPGSGCLRRRAQRNSKDRSTGN